MGNRKPFKDTLYSSLYGLFSCVGVPIGVQQLDRYNQEIGRFADIIQKEIRLNAIELIEGVQENLVKAFETLEDDKAALEARIVALESRNIVHPKSVTFKEENIDKGTIKIHGMGKYVPPKDKTSEDDQIAIDISPDNTYNYYKEERI